MTTPKRRPNYSSLSKWNICYANICTAEQLKNQSKFMMGIPKQCINIPVCESITRQFDEFRKAGKDGIGKVHFCISGYDLTDYQISKNSKVRSFISHLNDLYPELCIYLDKYSFGFVRACLMETEQIHNADNEEVVNFPMTPDNVAIMNKIVTAMDEYERSIGAS